VLNRNFLAALILLLPLPCSANVLNHKAKTIDGDEFNLAEKYKGKVVMIVNVASKCGYTPQYEQLQKMHEIFADKGLCIVGFPSNDFGDQEPGDDAAIKKFCTKNFGVTFDMMSKLQVKSGDGQHPLFKQLAADERFPGEISWNFEKFVIGRDGKLANRFRSKTGPGNPSVVNAVRYELATPEERKAIDPPALLEYKGRELAQTMHWRGAEWLMREMREKEEKTSEMMKNLGIKPGMNVADIGSGNGYHTLKMAKLIGAEAKAYAVDIQPEMLEMLEERAEKAGIENVVSVHNSFWDAKLPEDSIDLALMVDVYHEFSHPEQMLASLHRSLKTGGRIALVEFRMEDKKVPIKLLHKMSKEQIMKEFPANGFKLVGSYDELPWQHLMFFEKVETE
jgi:glutathione peroxidase-family protein/ubiquinone/menaquinone biosynthesis C-methylase UbiE